MMLSNEHLHVSVFWVLIQLSGILLALLKLYSIFGRTISVLIFKLTIFIMPPQSTFVLNFSESSKQYERTLLCLFWFLCSMVLVAYCNCLADRWNPVSRDRLLAMRDIPVEFFKRHYSSIDFKASQRLPEFFVLSSVGVWVCGAILVIASSFRLSCSGNDYNQLNEHGTVETVTSESLPDAVSMSNNHQHYCSIWHFLRISLYTTSWSFLFRGLCILTTLLPPPDLQCKLHLTQKILPFGFVDLQQTTPPSIWTDVFKLMTLQSRTCGDIFFSGHAIVYTVAVLSWVSLALPTAASIFGNINAAAGSSKISLILLSILANIFVTVNYLAALFSLLIFSYHYTIDVVIAVFVSGFIFAGFGLAARVYSMALADSTSRSHENLGLLVRLIGFLDAR